ncbi:hypothetical protein FJZ27_03105 [Candidatus Peribacteria bacterium]|nr:hypothetical protein [Candidatus Peribacteria bacterium]
MQVRPLQIGALLAQLFLVGTAFAGPPPVAYPEGDPCTYIGGRHCGVSAASVEADVNASIVKIVEFLAAGAGGLVVLYTVVGGLQMLYSFGDEGKFARGQTSVRWALIGFALVLGSQMIVNFIYDRARVAVGATPLLSLMTSIVDTITNLMTVIFVIVAMAAGVKAIIGQGKQEEFTAAKRAIGFAIAGAFVINLARALSKAVFIVLG